MQLAFGSERGVWWGPYSKAGSSLHEYQCRPTMCVLVKNQSLDVISLLYLISHLWLQEKC
jgi:hypothetical protein